MSASNKNSNIGTNNNEQKEQEVEAAEGIAYARGDDNTGEGVLPAKPTQDLEAA